MCGTVGSPSQGTIVGMSRAGSEARSARVVQAIVDHSIVEVIVNGDTAFVVYVAPSSKDTAGNARVFGQAG